MADPAFEADARGLGRALARLAEPGAAAAPETLPDALPETGLGEAAALDALAPVALGAACRLGAPHAFAHMDPPTPWVAWAATLWTAALNQNLLHPETAPVARALEARAVGWLAPAFGMDGGHMVPGSTIANLTALWAARERAGVRRVVASASAHLSVRKAAHLLGLAAETVPTDPAGRLDAAALPPLGDAALVLTAGTTDTGAIDPLALAGRAAWTHVDAAWAGPLRLTRHAARLDGVERADSVAVSAHKWLYQPKESALILFRETAASEAAISFGASYLAAPNVGVLGSHGAVAVPLLATLLAWGRAGLAARIERNMADAERLADWVAGRPDATLFARPETGVVLWRPTRRAAEAVRAAAPAGAVSLSRIGETAWLRNVAANPAVEIERLIAALEHALG